MKKFLIYFFLAGVFFLGTYWFFNSEESGVQTYIENRDLKTLETRFKPEEIMELRKEELMGNRARTLIEPLLVYYPYLLMDVKSYSKDKKSQQSMILWGLVDGEMVLDTDSWAKTKGFEEALNQGVTSLEFPVLMELAKARGSSTKERLMKNLNLEAMPFDKLIDSLKKKQLLIVRGSEILLHMANPNFNVPPMTLFNTQLVFKPTHEGKKVAAKYSRSKIEKIAKSAYGEDFTILRTEEVFLPVYRIGVQNPDNSVLLSDWNAVTGEKMF